jgi:biotin transport system substrate-specific component
MNTTAMRTILLNLCLVALFAALTAASGFVSIPLAVGVPIAIQNLMAILCGLLLGPFYGTLAVGLYIAAGAIGLPVFAGFAGGFAHFAKPSGGFLWGYMLAALVCGLIAGKPTLEKDKLLRLCLAVVAGFLVVYVPGLIQLKAILGVGWGAAMVSGMLPFLPGDALKAVLALLVAGRLRRFRAGLLEV